MKFKVISMMFFMGFITVNLVAGQKTKSSSCLMQSQKRAENFILSLIHNAQGVTEGTKDFCALEHTLQQFPSLVDYTDELGWTLLHEAAHVGNVDLCRLLIAFDADPYAQTLGTEDTPLHLAARVHAWEVIQFLYLDCEFNEEVNALGQYAFDHDCALCPLKYLDLVKEIKSKS